MGIRTYDLRNLSMTIPGSTTHLQKKQKHTLHVVSQAAAPGQGAAVDAAAQPLEQLDEGRLKLTLKSSLVHSLVSSVTVKTRSFVEDYVMPPIQIAQCTGYCFLIF
jgi:hypothetical protein